MREKIIKLNKALKDCTKEELIEKLGGLKKSELMRSIIINERDFCNCNYERSQRSFWYSVVKPTLDKLGQLTENDDTEKAIEGWDSTLSRYLTELVGEGKLSYKDIMITDESRNMNVPERYYFSPYRNIVVACEKDTIFNIVRDISELLGCSCLSSKGICGFGAMENLMRKIRDNSEKKFDEVIFLILSDYDPTGYIIANTIREQAEQISKNLNMDYKIVTERIGITPDQLSEVEVKNNMYTPKKKGIEKWMKLTDGINGLEKGLELDALSPEKIREIFADSLKKHIDSSEYIEHEKSIFLFRKIRSEIEKYTGHIVNEIYEKMIPNVTIQEFNILDYAKMGRVSIPSDQLCALNGNITELVESYFKE